jgi:glycosyltransferase involved in cell wall biosynthesis
VQVSEKMLQISVVVPLYDEAESLPELVAWIDRVMKAHHFSYEIILVDDGSKDSSWEVINSLKSKYSAVKGLRFKRNYGKSPALNEGFKMAQGNVVITMDADLQDSPDEIPELYRMIVEEKYDLVSGFKKKRYDPISKTIPSKFFNWVTRKISGIELHDFNCGLKAYRKNVIKSIEVYGEMHRFIPFIAKEAGFLKIGEKVVQHQARKYGHSKFGLNRFINGFLDLLSLSFILRFGRKPMHFFGLWGTVAFMLGFLQIIYMILEKMYTIIILNYPAIVAHNLTDRPLFYLSLTALIIGMQLFLAGFLAELISRSASDRNFYLVEEVID